jgi:hypothetical protein
MQQQHTISLTATHHFSLMEHHTKRRRLAALASSIVVLYLADEFLLAEYSEISEPVRKGKPPGSRTIFRERTEETHNFLHTMTSRLFRRRYRMKKSSFFIYWRSLIPT